jgi:hypothetical protein
MGPSSDGEAGEALPSRAVSIPDDRSAADHLEPGEREPEASPEDVVEQAAAADPSEEEPAVHLGDDASEWDAIEQSRVVHLEDDYRDQ